MRLLLITLSATSLLAVAGPAAAGPLPANLVSNGSFETSAGTGGNGSAYGQVGYNVNLPGWTIDPNAGNAGYSFVFNSTNVGSGVAGQFGNLSLWTTSNGGVNTITASPDGGNFVGIDGAFQQAALEQTVNGLSVGVRYDLSFYWGAAQQNGFTGPTTDQFQVSLGGQTQNTGVIALPNHGFSGWQQQNFFFTATSASELLSFFAIGTPQGVPPFAVLDGVNLGVAVPEPAVIGLFAAGLLGVVGLRRRRAV